VIFGRLEVTDRWVVAYARGWPAHLSGFRANLRAVAHVDTATAWCIVYGSTLEQFRQVVTLFSNKWLVYDRYGQFTFQRGTRLCDPRPLGPGTSAASERVDGPVPFTQYKSTEEKTLTP
jgi:hypothetical protein